MGDDHLSAEAMERLLAAAMTPEELAACDVHLRACADCRAKLDEMTPTIPEVAALFSLSPTPRASLSNAPPGFELLEILGAGKTATVYRARQARRGRIVSLKMLSVGWPNDAEAQRRFHLEMSAAASLDHPHIVQVFEVGTYQGRPFFVMEFCSGGNLADRLRDGPLPPRQAATLLELLARTLHTIHENGFVHRDLKPANILFDDEGNAKVADFGIVKCLGAVEPFTREGSLLGTPPYLAPEQIDNSVSAGSRCDVYALGAIFYECLIGRPPFRSRKIADILFDVLSREPLPPRRVDPYLPVELDTICLKCLEKEPARRYGSALELAKDLRRFLNGQLVRARPVRLPGKAWRWVRRYPISALFAASLLLTAMSGLALCCFLWYQADASRRETETARRDAEENFLRTRRLLPELVTASSDRAQQGVERSRIRRSTLERACSHYRELCRVRPDDGELQSELAHVLIALAQAALSEGRYDSAIAASEEALALWRPLLETEPRNPRWRTGAARALLCRASGRGFLGQSPEMADTYREAIAFLQALADEQPREAAPLLDTVAARVKLLEALFGDAKIDESLSLLEENRKQLESRAAVADSVELRLALVETLYLLGQRYQLRGDADAAVRCWRTGCRQGAGLDIALPYDGRACYYPTACALALPRGESTALTPAQAIPRLEQAVQRLEVGYALDQEQTWSMLAVVARSLADCYLDVGRASDAVRVERRAAEALPPDPDGIPVLDLVRIQGKACLARRERQAGQTEAARLHAREAAESFETFCRTHATDSVLLDAAIDFCPRLAPPLRHAASDDQARRIVECSLQVLQQRESAKTDASQLRRLAEVWVQLAKCRMRDDPKGVEAALREAVDAARRLVNLRPEHRYLLDDRLSRLARWLTERGQLPQAAACLRECEHLWVRDAVGLRGVARNFRALAKDMKLQRNGLSNAEMAEYQGYLAEATRLEKAADALRH